MNYKSVLAVAVVALFAFAVVPIMSDGSDATGSLTDGSAGIGYSVKDLSGDDLAKIMPESRQLASAKDALSDIIADDVGNYTFTEVKMTEFCKSQYQGTEISGKEVSDVETSSVSYKISFVATCTAGGNELFENASKNVDIIKQIGTDNLSQTDAVFTVSCTVKNVMTNQETTTYDGNGSNDLFVNHKWNKYAVSITSKADVTYKFKDGVSDKTVEFSTDVGRELSTCVDTSYDFNGVASKDVTDLTRALVTYDTSQYGIHYWNLVKYDGNEKGDDAFSIDPYYMMVDHAYENASPQAVDIKVPTYTFYGTSSAGVIALYTSYDSIADDLRDNAKMKEFLAAHGSVSEDYSSAKSAAQDDFNEVSYFDEIKLALIIVAVVIGVAALLFLILIIVVIILIVKRKKR